MCSTAPSHPYTQLLIARRAERHRGPSQPHCGGHPTSPSATAPADPLRTHETNPMAQHSYRIGIDIGGTFTDIVRCARRRVDRDPQSALDAGRLQPRHRRWRSRR